MTATGHIDELTPETDDGAPNPKPPKNPNVHPAQTWCVSETGALRGRGTITQRAFAALDELPRTEAEVAEDAARLTELEAAIRNSEYRYYVAVGTALREILEKRLYKVRYSTFELYCERQWDCERRQAYNYIEAARVFENVHLNAQNPPSLTQAVELARLNPDHQRELATKLDFASVTVKNVRHAVTGMLGGTQPELPQPPIPMNVEPTPAEPPAGSQAVPTEPEPQPDQPKRRVSVPHPIAVPEQPKLSARDITAKLTALTSELTVLNSFSKNLEYTELSEADKEDIQTLLRTLRSTAKNFAERADRLEEATR